MSERVAGLDLLRGLAAICVAVPHFILIDRGSSTLEGISVVAVEVFFVLSGFVLGPQILRCTTDGVAALRVFLLRRWMRTIPPYLLALSIMSLLTQRLFSGDFWRYAFYVENLLSQHNEIDYYPVAWSLSVEEWFYIIVPIALVAICRRRNVRQIALVVTTFIAVVTIFRLLTGNTANWGPDIRRVVIFRIDSIGYGFLLWLAMSQHLIRLGRPSAAALFAAFASLTLICAIFGDRSPAIAQSFPFVAAACGCSAVILFKDLALKKTITAISLFLGRISYSLYLLHLPIGLWVHVNISGFSLAGRTAAFLIICAFACTAFFIFFERPILRARPRYSAQFGSLPSPH